MGTERIDAEASALTGSELDEVIASATRSREADRELATALRRRGPAGEAAGTGYLGGLERRVPLTASEERELVAAAQAGDAGARGRLVDAFMPLIASVARVYRESPRVERLELLQEGVLGLLRALERYDSERGVPFWGYAAFWVRQAMQQLVSELTRPAVLSDRALGHLARLKDARRSAVQETGREPGRAELVARTGLTGEQVDALLAVETQPRSIDEPVVAEDGSVTFGELLVDPLAEGEYERVLDAIEVEELLALLSALSDREREIVRARHGLDGEQRSLGEIGGRLGLSAERVRQLESRALGKLAAAAGNRASVGDR